MILPEITHVYFQRIGTSGGLLFKDTDTDTDTDTETLLRDSGQDVNMEVIDVFGAPGRN